LKQSITIRALDDGIEEVAEKFAVKLGTPTGGGGANAPQAEGSPQIGTIPASAGDVSTPDTERPRQRWRKHHRRRRQHRECNCNLHGEAERRYAARGNLTAAWAVEGLGAQPVAAADFVGAGDSLPSGELVFSDVGEMQFTLTLLADVLVEGTESFRVKITATGGGPGDNIPADPLTTSVTDTTGVHTIVVSRDRTDVANEAILWKAA